MAPHSPIDGYQRFGAAYFFHFLSTLDLKVEAEFCSEALSPIYHTTQWRNSKCYNIRKRLL
jgi:hypothetical protein